MRTAVISSLLFAVAAYGLPDISRKHKFFNIDWEVEILGKNPLQRRARSEKSLDTIFKAIGKQYFGTCADANLLNNAQNAEILKADFGQLTPENR